MSIEETKDTVVSETTVSDEIFRLLPASLELVGFAFLLAILIGIPVGVLSATRRRSPVDHASRIFAILGVSLPSFWLAMIFQLIFAKWLGIFPVFGRVDSLVALTSPLERITGFYLLDSLLSGNILFFASSAHHIVLPALTLAAYPVGLIVRMVRTMMIEVLQENYIRTARAFGLPRGYVLYVYALKNGIAPSLVILGLSFAYSLVGAFLVEIIFSWPGLGTFAFLSIVSFDYPAIIGVTLVVAIFYVVINLLVDLAQSFLDPRVALDVGRG
jgi:peptide/nickel transport system permease protein